MSKVVFAIGAHPDDIEFMMAGTLMLLGEAGYEMHYMTVANGSGGSSTTDRAETIAIRAVESRNAAAAVGATHHEPLVDDIQIYYTPELVARLCAVVRQVDPEIMLVPSPQDYMEDHMNTSRLAVTAAFCRNVPNFATDPATEAVNTQAALYHAQPWGLKDQLRNTIQPHLFVDITSMAERKRQALACHRSQKEWLDVSQGTDSYLDSMSEMSAEVGRMSGRFEHAEGWRRHSHGGLADSEAFDPLTETLGELVAFPQ